MQQVLRHKSYITDQAHEQRPSTMRGAIHRQEHRWCQLRVPPAGLAFLKTPFTQRFAFRCRAMTRVYFIELYFPQYNFSISFVALEADASQRYIL